MIDESGLESARVAAIRSMLTDAVTADAPKRTTHRRVVVAFSLAAAVVLVIAGVGLATNGFVPARSGGAGSGNEHAPVAVAPTESPAPGPSSSPLPGNVAPAGPGTATPIPTTGKNDPLRPLTWTITPRSMGPITLGEQAKSQLLAAGFAYHDVEGCITEYQWQSVPSADLTDDIPRMMFYLDSAGRVVHLQFYGPAESGAPATAEGITLGSTIAELRAAYPQLRTVSAASLGAYYATGEIDGGYYSFGTNKAADGSETVTSIDVTGVPQGQPLCTD